MVIDISPIVNFFSLPPDQQMAIFFWQFGWMPIAIMFLYGCVEAWVYWRSVLWTKTLRFVLLAIDIPKANDQSLRAVENFFSYFGGGHDPSDLIEKYWIGKYQIGVSFEIVSIEGYIQYLVRTPIQMRGLVEAGIYSQYPDAEITEVDDYVDSVPGNYPNDEYNIWGGEMILQKNDVYPILTYKNFEHQMGLPEKQFKDPLAVLMDTMSSMKKGEQLWYQIIVYPTDVRKLEDKGAKEISKILKENGGSKKKGIWGEVAGETLGIFSGIISEFTGQSWGGKEERKDDALKMMNLKPREKKQVEAIQQKVSKQVFETKIRFIYVAKKEVYNKSTAVFGFIGYMKQFLDVDLNGLKPDMKVTVTTAHYLFIESRKSDRQIRLMAGYKGRSGTRGRARFMLNAEELATLWHVPIEAVVRAPLIQKAPGRKGEPPMSLPITEPTVDEGIFGDNKNSKNEDIFFDFQPGQEIASDKISQEVAPPVAPAEQPTTAPTPAAEKIKGAPPENLPFA